MRSIKTYLNRPKTFNPIKKIKYAHGLGDVITCFLHSRYFGVVTYLITGKLEPCGKCDNRRKALNILFPIPVWRLFFKTYEDLNKHLDEEYEKNGVYKVENLNKMENTKNPEYIEMHEPPTKITLTMEDLIKINNEK